MGALDHLKEKRAMRYQKGDRVFPGDSPAGTPSRGAPPGPRKQMGELPLPPPAPYGRPRRKTSCSLCHCLWCFLSFLVILIILAGLTVLIIYVIFLPKLPKYSLQNVAISQLAVTNRAGGPITSLADLQDPVLNADIDFTILVQNPNGKLGIHYKDVSVFVYYEGVEFAHSFVPNFYQASNTSSQIVVDLKATSAPLSQSQGQQLQTAISQNDISLSAQINVGASLQIGSLELPPGYVRVSCNLHVSPPTAPDGAKLLSKSCSWKKV